MLVHEITNYLIYIALGVLPSLVWLFFYLREDVNPEPNEMIIKVFLAGMIFGPLAIALEYSAAKFSQVYFHFDSARVFLLNILLFAPLFEEYLKYRAVKWQVLKNPAFDEPLDAMLYLVISALGFAAIENIIYIIPAPAEAFSMANVCYHTFTRFLTAVFLHTLSSGILGFFIAKSFLDFKHRKRIFITGFFLAFLFHSFYNYLAGSTYQVNGAIAGFLMIVAAIVIWQFKNLKKQLSICKL